MKVRTVSMIFGLMMSTTAVAQPALKPRFNFTEKTTGSEFYQLCRNDYAECESILLPLEVGFKLRELSERVRGYCPPDPLSPVQTRLIIMKRFAEHPETLHKPAVDLARSALRLAFPCSNSN
jgi:hypothetical protein